MIVLSIEGKIIQTYATFKNQIDTTELKKGQYLLQLKTTNGIASKPFIVK